MKKTIRLSNFVIDFLVYILLLILFLFFLQRFIPKENVKWIAVVMYCSYYFLFEYIIGQTIGQMMTKTKVVSTAKNSKFYAIQLLGRSIIRISFIDPISYLLFHRGLHDRMSATKLTNVTAEN